MEPNDLYGTGIFSNVYAGLGSPVGGGQQSDYLAQLQKLLSPNPLSLGINLGGQVLGGLFSLLGNNEHAKRQKEVYNLAKNRLGQSPINPDQYLAQYYRTLGPQMNKRANSINSRLGLDSGVAQAELGSSLESQLANFHLGAQMKNAELKAQLDQYYLNLMGQVA